MPQQPSPAQAALTSLEVDIPEDRIAQVIFVIRDKRVILDSDLAILYGVRTKAMNQAIKRNQDRFPQDFAFRLSAQELGEVVTNCDRLVNMKYSNVPPLAFTEHGAIAAAFILNSPMAVQVSVQVVRAFIKLRQMVEGYRGGSKEDLGGRLSTLESVSHVHGGRLDAIETTLSAMEGRPQAVLHINVQGDMIGNTVTGVLDAIREKASLLELDEADQARLQEAIRVARMTSPETSRGREALHVVKSMLEHAGGAVIGHGLLAQLARFIH